VIPVQTISPELSDTNRRVSVVGFTTYEALAILGHNFPSWSAARVSKRIQTAEKTRRSFCCFFLRIQRPYLVVRAVRKGTHHELPSSTSPAGVGTLAWTSTHDKGALTLPLPAGECDA